MKSIRKRYRDSKRMRVRNGWTVYEAGRRREKRRPSYCYHERRAVVGNCRMCIVEREGGVKPVPGCVRPVTNNRKVRTKTPRVKKAREGVRERRLRNHPLDCPICDQGGECDLQEQTIEYGSDRSRRREVKGEKRGVEDKERGPVVKTVMTRCIHCTRCVRFVSERGGVGERGRSGRGNEAEVGSYVEKKRKTPRSGNRVDRCPVGALTNKDYEFVARPWEREKVDGVDSMDSIGSARERNRRRGKVIRVRPKRNDERNSERLGDKSRRGYDGERRNRREGRYREGERRSRTEKKNTKERKKRKENRKNRKGKRSRVGTGVDRERVKRRKEEERKGNRKRECRGIGKRGERRLHSNERVRKGGRKEREKKETRRTVGVERNKDRPLRKAIRKRKGERTEERTVGNTGGKKSREEKRKKRSRGGKRTDRKERVEGKSRGRKKRKKEGKQRSVRRGGGRWERKDGDGWRKRTKRRELGEKEKGRVSVLNHRTNTVGRGRRNVKGVVEKERLEKKEDRRRVGRDDGERKEKGRRVEQRGKVKGLWSTHGRNGRSDVDRRRPRNSGCEEANRRVNREGKGQRTLGKGERREEVGERPRNGVEEYETCETTERRKGWNTRNMENRYDYYREGNRRNRVSKKRGECSKEREESNV
jgi:NADH-quinone oxidoreductase subunit G